MHIPTLIVIASTFSTGLSQVCQQSRIRIGSDPENRPAYEYPYFSSILQIFEYLKAPCSGDVVLAHIGSLEPIDYTLRVYLGVFQSYYNSDKHYIRLVNHIPIDIPYEPDQMSSDNSTRKIEIPAGYLRAETGNIFGIFYDNWKFSQNETVVRYKALHSQLSNIHYKAYVGIFDLPQLARISQLRVGTEVQVTSEGRIPAMSLVISPRGDNRTTVTTPLTTEGIRLTTCGPVPNIENAMVTFTSVIRNSSFLGDTIEYTCLPGYRMIIGDYYRVTCREPMSWSVLPECVKDNSTTIVITTTTPVWKPPETEPVVRCVDFPGYVLNGFEVSRSFRQVAFPGERIVFACRSEYIMLGSGELICQKNGTWSKLPECSRGLSECYLNPEPVNAVLFSQTFILGQRAVEGDSIKYMCMIGFQSDARGADTRFVNVVCRGGMWSDDTPKCYPTEKTTTDPSAKPPNSCGEPPKFANAVEIRRSFLSGQVSRPGDYIAYGCIPGYLMKGNGEINCLGDLLWTMNFQCISTNNANARNSPRVRVPATINPSNCGFPPVLENAFVDSQYSKFIAGPGEFVTYTCKPNFLLIGSPNVFCNADLSWSVRFRCARY